MLVCSPWSWQWAAVKILSGWLVWQEGRRARLRFRQRCGAVTVNDAGLWHWQQQEWHTRRRPGWLPFAVLLSLESERGQRCCFWLMHDAMPPQDWRALRMHWFYCQRARF